MSEKAVSIVGLGLIGGTLGLALRRLGVRVLGVDAKPEVAQQALKLGAADEAGTDISRVSQASFVVLAVPIQALVGVTTAMMPHLQPGTVVIDVASVKGSVVGLLERLIPPHAHFLGAHPMCGSAGHGSDAADVTMLPGRPFIITPTAQTHPEAIRRTEEFIASLDMRMVRMTPEVHDQAVAGVSHLTYLIAAALTRSAPDLEVAGPAFRDSTRVAASPTALWNVILEHNDAAVTVAVQKFIAELQALVDTKGNERLKLLEGARLRREQLPPLATPPRKTDGKV